MDLSRRRGGGRSNVVAGSVWESRIRFDEGRGGVKVFNGDDGNGECGAPATGGGGAASARRKTWRSDEGFNSILIAEEKPESESSGDEQNRKSPIPARRLRSNSSPIKPTHESSKSSGESGRAVRESGDRTEKNSARKKTDQSRKPASGFSGRIVGDAKQTTKTTRKEEPTNEIEKSKVEIGRNISEKSFEEFNEFKSKLASSAPQVFFDAYEEEENEIVKESFDVKEINLPERKKITNGYSFTEAFSSASARRSFPGNKQKLQTLMDLIMWRDFSRSGLVFGIGTSIIIVSSFIQNIHISFISVMSHVGLLYLASIYLHRSIFSRRKEMERDDENDVVGEEDAIRLAKRILPYVNDFLLNLKALFRGDPATTIKLAVLLFVLAKWGSFITLWNLVKCGFVGVFTLPKLITHGREWTKIVGNSWTLCSHKKAMVIAIFFLVWNFSSILSRIWAAFIVFVSFRCYEESSRRDVWAKEGKKGNEARPNDTVLVSSKLKRQY